MLLGMPKLSKSSVLRDQAYFCVVSISLAIVAQGPGNLVLVRTHVVPMSVLAAKAARYVRTKPSLGRMTKLTANVASGRSVAQDDVIQLESELEKKEKKVTISHPVFRIRSSDSLLLLLESNTGEKGARRTCKARSVQMERVSWFRQLSD